MQRGIWLSFVSLQNPYTVPRSHNYRQRRASTEYISWCRYSMDRARRWQDLRLCPGCQAWSGPDRTHPEQLAGPPYWQCDCAGDHSLGGVVEWVLSRHHPSVAQCSQAGRRCSSCPLISLMHAPFLVVSLHDMHEMLMHLLHLFQRVTIMVCFQFQLYPLASCCRSSADQLLQELNTT